MKTTGSVLSSAAADAGMVESEALRRFETSPGLLPRLWRWLRAHPMARSHERRLQVAETVSLGEKRFVAVVQVDGRHFLLAGGPANIALLAQLNEKEDFQDVLKKTMVTPAPLPGPVTSSVPEKPAKKPARRQKKVVAAASPASSQASKASTASQKRSTVAAKKKPAATGKKALGRPTNQERFGDIPPAAHQGVRAFDQWLGRAVPPAAGQTHNARSQAVQRAEPAQDKRNPAVSKGLPPLQTMSEWMQEARTQPEKAPVQGIASTAAEPTVEEYA